MKGISKRHPGGILPAKDDKVTISSEYYENIKPSYICSICSQGPLSRLSDAGGNNSTYWCKNCSVSYDPMEENVRKESKLTVPEETEPVVATTPTIGADAVAIRKEKKLEWGAAELAKRGLKFTHVEEGVG